MRGGLTELNVKKVGKCVIAANANLYIQGGQILFNGEGNCPNTNPELHHTRLHHSLL